VEVADVQNDEIYNWTTCTQNVTTSLIKHTDDSVIPQSHNYCAFKQTVRVHYVFYARIPQHPG